MLEAELRDLLASQITVLEKGLVVLKTEQYVPNTIGTRSFIDILAKDRRGRWVLIELKRSNVSSREAIHEVYKYVEAVKGHLGARDDEIRAIVVSSEWKELLVPFSRFAYDTSISVLGIEIAVSDCGKFITAKPVQPLEGTSGRTLSPWHEISFYCNETRLAEGIASYDASCQAKGMQDYIMVELKAAESFYEKCVLATAASLRQTRGDISDISEQEIADLVGKIARFDHIIYFVPQLQTAANYLEMIRTDPDQYEEAKELKNYMKGDELLLCLQEYALDASPKVDRDYIEIGYPAKFRNKLLADEAWTTTKVHRRGAFARNTILTDETILGEIGGDDGKSGQRLKRTINLSDKSEFSQILKDINEALPNNSVWAGMVRAHLEEARADYPGSTADLSIFAPSTGLMTIFIAATKEQWIQYIPSFEITIYNSSDIVRLYCGELLNKDNLALAPETFSHILKKYYGGKINSFILTVTWGGYETRDIDLMNDLGLIYSSFRCDLKDKERVFLRMKDFRWCVVEQIVPFAGFLSYCKINERLLRIIALKLMPLNNGGFWNGNSADSQLEASVDSIIIAKSMYHSSAPEDCDICSIPLADEKFFSDGRLKGKSEWANMCSDCSVHFGAGIAWGTGQLYRKESDGQWLMVGGFLDEDDYNGE